MSESTQKPSGPNTEAGNAAGPRSAEVQSAVTDAASTKATAESTSQKAFITTIVSILLSPLSVALGFYLNHALQKPQLRVDTLDKTYYTESRTMPEFIRNSLQALPLLSAQIRDVITRTELAKGEISCVDWLDGKPWRDGCFDTVLTAARGMDSAVLAAAASRPPKGLESVVPSPAEVIAARSAIKTLVDWLVAASADTHEVRSGKMCFQANIINSGDFDGVVLRFASLKFPTGTISIGADKYTVIKAHGYDKVEFCTDIDAEGEKASHDAWAELVKTFAKTSFDVEITTGDGIKLTSKNEIGK